VAWIVDRVGLSRGGPGVEMLTLGGRTLLAALLAALAFSALLVLAPLGALRRKEEGAEASPLSSPVPWILYFGSLGLGYILVEIIALQRFNLYLGNPSYSLSVVLFTMLTASGLGSFAAGAWFPRIHLGRLLFLVTVGVGVYVAWLPWWIDTTLGSATWTRVVVAIVVTAPTAFLMGMPFPIGLRRADEISKRLVSWGWALNGGASVLGSVLAVVAAMTWGFTQASMVGLAAYASALGAAVAISRSSAGDPQGPALARASTPPSRRSGG